MPLFLAARRTIRAEAKIWMFEARFGSFESNSRSYWSKRS
jgi:hypothetical protein